MKTWIKIFAGTLTGTLLAIFLPQVPFILETAEYLKNLVVSMGRYIITPLLFFSLIVAACQLQREKKLLSVFIKTVAYAVGASLVLILTGIAASLVYNPGIVRENIKGVIPINIPTFKEVLTGIFPDNMFHIFNNSADIMLPLIILAILLGYFFTKDREEAEPAYNVADSFSRILYKINSFFISLTFFWSLILSYWYTTEIMATSDFSILPSLTLMLGITSAAVIFIIYPVIYYYMSGKQNPLKYLYSTSVALVISVLSGNIFFTQTAMIKTAKENMGIRRQSAAFTLPVLSIISKAGTAMVSVISFIVILKSNSSLDITLFQIVWIAGVSFLVSFCLPTIPGVSIFASLHLIFQLYGNTMQDSYLILKSAMPILATASAILNCATILLITNLIADRDQRKEYVSVKEFY